MEHMLAFGNFVGTLVNCLVALVPTHASHPSAPPTPLTNLTTGTARDTIGGFPVRGSSFDAFAHGDRSAIARAIARLHDCGWWSWPLLPGGIIHVSRPAKGDVLTVPHRETPHHECTCSNRLRRCTSRRNINIPLLETSTTLPVAEPC